MSQFSKKVIQWLIEMLFFSNSPCPLVNPQPLHYRCYKSNTVRVVKRRGGLLASCDPSSEVPEEGSMTGLSVTDRETGKSVAVSISTMETETGRLS